MKCVSLAENLVAGAVKDARLPKEASAGCRFATYAKSTEENQARAHKTKPKNARKKTVVRQNVGDKVATLGSEETIFSSADCGLFASVLTAYNNHWKLRTSPDDWWFCVTRRVAMAIDKHSKKDSVRKMFVNHEGKMTLSVRLPENCDNIYDVDYSWFFDEMSKLITENVKVPEYIDAVTADFTSTTPVQKIVSQLTIMSSLQEFFEFAMLMPLCGIPAVEMLGTDDDWAKLKSKLKVLKTLLEPIENDIELTSDWWSCVEKVFEKLLATFRGVPDKDWWSRIVSRVRFGSGASSAYNGWITQFLEGREGAMELKDFSGGLVTVPLTIDDHKRCIKDTAALVAGMLGFTLHEDTIDQVPSVQPFQGWSLLLSEKSPFRNVRN